MSSCGHFYTAASCPSCDEAAAVKEAVGPLVAMLRELEWHHGECLVCDGGRHTRTHAIDCKLAAILKEHAS